MTDYKRLEETRRTGSNLAEKPFSGFQIFRSLSESSALRVAYERMQKNYVFSEKDVLPYSFVVKQWEGLLDELGALNK